MDPTEQLREALRAGDPAVTAVVDSWVSAASDAELATCGPDGVPTDPEQVAVIFEQLAALDPDTPLGRTVTVGRATVTLGPGLSDLGASDQLARVQQVLLDEGFAWPLCHIGVAGEPPVSDIAVALAILVASDQVHIEAAQAAWVGAAPWLHFDALVREPTFRVLRALMARVRDARGRSEAVK